MATVQVALQGSARHLQDELAQVAEREDTRSQRGLKPLLQDAALEVLRNLEHCVYGLVSSSRRKSASNAERAFHNDSIESRSQYHEETLSNTLGQQNQAETSSGTREGDAPDECVVVTLLASASASSELPKMRSREDMQKALKALASLPEEPVRSVEVMWTPQREEECLTREGLVQDHPPLSALGDASVSRTRSRRRRSRGLCSVSSSHVHASERH
jgi:uncharacterized membrane protein